jgi:hypothetical protein
MNLQLRIKAVRHKRKKQRQKIGAAHVFISRLIEPLGGD